ncbi:polysaccharide deacetylase family protein [Hafnia paralvei]
MKLFQSITAGLLFSLWVIFTPNTAIADLLPDSWPQYQYMEAERDSEIYSLVGEHVIPVGQIQQGQILNVFQADSEYYEFRFGNGTGFIAREDLKEPKKRDLSRDNLSDLRKKSFQNLVTSRPVTVYSQADNQSTSVAILEENLRYPILDKQKDRLNQTWYAINLGDRFGYVSALDADLDNGIAVLTYHHILKNEENKRFRRTSTTTSDVAFSNQMAYLKQAGYSTLSMYQLEGYLTGSMNLPAKAVVLTFDDGLKSVYRYAYPVLKQNGQRATAFIISSRIKRHPQTWNPNGLQFMSISELREIQDVFDIQSHTHFLHRVSANKQPILFSRSYHNILFDFQRSRRALSQFNPHVQYLSYPFGGYNQKAMDAARDAGFHLAVTTVQGRVRMGDNPFALKRLYVLRTDSVQSMAALIANNPQPVPEKPSAVPVKVPAKTVTAPAL